MELRFNSNLYSKIALLKAAFHFTDVAYLHLDYEDPDYIVRIRPKKQGDEISAEEFKNEMLMQELRREISDRTGDLRTLIAARALASTVIGEQDVPLEEGPIDTTGIFKDWFEDENS